jgi:hypothetical protein
MPAPQPIGNAESGITLYYVPPDNEVPNIFASFWANYLKTRTPWANQVFTARLKAMDPGAQAKALASLEAQRVALMKIQAGNEQEAAKLANARDIESSQAKRGFYQSDISAYNAEVGASATKAAAAMGLEGDVIKAGTLTDRSKQILGEHRTREQAVQLELDRAAALGPTPEGKAAYQLAQQHMDQVMANTKRQIETVPPVERSSLLSTIQGDPMALQNAQAQTYVQRMRSGLGTAGNIEVPLPGVGSRNRPDRPESTDLPPLDVGGDGRQLRTPRSVAAEMSSGGAAEPSRGNGRGSRSATTSTPSSTSAGPPGPSSGTRAPSPTARPSPEESAPEPDERSSARSAVDRRSNRSDGTFNNEDLQDELERLTGVEKKLLDKRAADPTGGLGSHFDPLPDGSKVKTDSEPKERTPRGVMSDLYPARPNPLVTSREPMSEPDDAPKGPAEPMTIEPRPQSGPSEARRPKSTATKTTSAPAPKKKTEAPAQSSTTAKPPPPAEQEAADDAELRRRVAAYGNPTAERAERSSSTAEQETESMPTPPPVDEEADAAAQEEQRRKLLQLLGR